MAEPWKSAPVVSSGAAPWKSAPMVEAAPFIRENYNADPTWFDKINEGATGNILAPSQGRGDDPISRAVKGVGSSLERTTKAWADALSLNPSDTTAAEMIPLLGPAAVDAVRMMSTPGQGFQGIGAAGALLAPAVAGELAARSAARPAAAPKPSAPVNAGKLMSTAKSGAVNVGVRVLEKAFGLPPGSGKIVKNIVEAVREEMAGKTTEVAPPTPTVVEAPPVASGTPVRPPLRGKQFGTFNDPTVPPLPAGVTPAGPVLPPLVEAAPPVAPGVPLRPPLRGRQFGTTVAKMMREEVPGRQFGTSSQSRLVPAEVPAATVPAEVPPAAVETPQPATPAPSAAGEPVTAATLMEEVANPAAQVNNPNYDWRAPEGITAAFKQYLKDSGFDVVPDRPEFDPTNPKAQGKFGGSAKTQVNMDAKANRFVEYLKANKMEPTPDNVARATQTLGEADHPSAHTLEKIYTQMGYDALDVEMLARSMAKEPVAMGKIGDKIISDGRPNPIREISAPNGDAPSGARPSTGKKTEVFIPGERQSIPARYEVRELGEIKSSHNGSTFSHNPEYELQNERDYSKPENQQRVIEQSSEENFRHQFHITDNPDMSNGPPLLDEGGNALEIRSFAS